MSNHAKILTPEKLKGIDVVVKSISRLYPFIKGWQFNENWERWETLIAIDFLVDYKEFANYLGKEKLFDYTYKTKMLNLTDIVTHTYYDEVYNLSEDIKKRAESLYSSLPEDIVFKRDDNDTRCKLSPSFFMEFKSTESSQG